VTYHSPNINASPITNSAKRNERRIIMTFTDLASHKPSLFTSAATMDKLLDVLG